MARFGLVDSDSESDASTHGEDRSNTSRSRTTSPPRDDLSLDYGDDDEATIEQDEDEELADAPPRASLLSSDDDDDEEDDDSGDASFDALSSSTPPPQPRSRLARSTRSPSHAVSQASGHGSPAPPARRRQLDLPRSAHHHHQQQQPQPWAQQLKLEPKRVAVMQATFFGQAPKVDERDTRDRERQELDEARDVKRRQVEKGLAQRAAATTTSSLFPTVSTPATAGPASVPTPIVDPAPFCPLRTYSRVALADSIAKGKEGNAVDEGLALGRSYRVGWGRKGEIVSLTGVYDPSNAASRSDVLHVEKLRLVPNDDKASSLRLLKLQLEHSQIFASSESDPSSPSTVPFASPVPSLRFSHFVELFSSSSDSSASTELRNSSEAQLFELASCLFDEVPNLGISEPSGTAAAGGAGLEFAPTPAYTSSITSLRRRDALSSWLSQTLLPSVTASLHSSRLNPLQKIFLLLTAHELSSACDLALTSSNLRLATLISQIGPTSSSSTDPGFQRDLERQLEKWREYKVDSHLPDDVRKIYEVLSGNLGVSPGRTQGGIEDRAQEVHVLEGLEWKAAFAMGLWYGRNERRSSRDGLAPEEDEVARAVEAYEHAFDRDSRVSLPLPSYAPVTSPTSAGSTHRDPIYHLLKLYTSPTHSLEAVLEPKNFGPCPTDYRLPWHLYLLFSRVLRRRDFEDRVEVEQDGDMDVGETGNEVEGNSVRADQVTVSYAAQLESLGMWEWSAFVLLHLELEAPRADAIQQLLTRHITSVTPELEQFIVSTLQIPPTYLSRARATHAQSIGDVFSTYKLLLSSQLAERAHRIAVEDLVPEAIVRGDKSLVERLLEPFREDVDEEDEDGAEAQRAELRGSVEEWEMGGKVYLQYLRTLSLFSSASTQSLSSSISYLSQTIVSVQRFAQRARTTERTKGNKKLKMAVSEMQSRLNVLSRSLGGKPLSVTQPSTLPESDKLTWLQGATHSFLEASLRKAGPAITA
ncbi:hypothetical protein JCM10212_005076 [Sporobolomyces blumeae]